MARLPAGVLAAGWLVPAVVGSAVLWLIVLALAPPPLGVAGFLGGAALCVALACGCLERPALRMLALARPATEAEQAALGPVLAMTLDRGLLRLPETPRGVLVRAHQWPRMPAVLVGRGRDECGTLVVTPWLIEAIGRRAITVEEADAIVVHAVGRRQGVRHRFEVALTAWLLPWQAVRVLVATIAAGSTRFSLMRPAWQLRWIVGGIAVIQSAYEGRTVSGILAGALIALTYLVPTARRRWESRRTAAGDQLVTTCGLGVALVRLMDRHGQPLPRERRQRLQGRTSARSPSTTTATVPPVDDPQPPLLLSVGVPQGCAGDEPERAHLRLVRS